MSKASNMPEMPRPPRWLAPTGWAGLGAFVAAQVTGFLISPPDRAMGNLQKIMYVHVPSAWVAMLGFFIVFVASLLYLWRRDLKHDRLAASTAEVSVLFTGLTLALGSIWGRPTWGIWWTWDPRLTSTAIMLLIYVGYLALRSFTEDEERRARWSAAVGILGFLNVPIVYFSVKWWNSLHQMQSTPNTVSSAFHLPLRVNAIGILLLLIGVITLRTRIAKMRLREELAPPEPAAGTAMEYAAGAGR